MRSSSLLTALTAVSSAFAAPRLSDNESKRPGVAGDSSHAHSSSVDDAEAASIAPAGSGSSDDKDAPVAPRAPMQSNNDIANLLLLLEYIETALYAQGLANYSQEDFCEAGFDPGLYGNLQTIYGDQQVSRPHPLSPDYSSLGLFVDMIRYPGICDILAERPGSERRTPRRVYIPKL